MRRNIILVLMVGAVLLCTATVTQLFGIGARRGLVQQLARIEPKRPFAPRLSIPTKYQPCTAQRTDSVATVPTETCASDQEPRNLRVFERAGGGVDPDSLQGSALAALIWWDEKEQSLDAPIERLNKALRLSIDPVPLLVDLSAAHLVRAERAQNPYDLFRGLEFAYEALSHESRNGTARYNAALALEMIGLEEQAALEWKTFLAVDSVSPSADEARRRMAELITPPVPTRPPGASPAEVKAFAQQHPQEARELGFDSILDQWGMAVERGEKARADSLLALAEALGQALTEREGGDASLRDAVRAIRASAPDAAATMALARAHRAYAEGQKYLDLGNPFYAMTAFTRVIEVGPPSPVLLQWARVFRTAMLMSVAPDKLKETIRELRAQVARVNGVDHPALAGRSRLILGTMLTRNTQPGDARVELAAAKGYLSRAGEAQLAAAALSGTSEAARALGDTVDMYSSAHGALQTLHRDRQSRSLHNILVALGEFVEQDEMPYAAWAIYNEDIAVATRMGIAASNVEVYLARARVRRVVGDSLGATQDVDSAAEWMKLVPDDHAQKQWAEARIRLARPQGVPAAQIDSAVEALAHNVVWHVPALLRRADLRLDKDDVPGAIADLQAVTESVRGLTRQQEDAGHRSAMIEQARSRFDRLIMLQVRNRQVHDALRTLERSRMSFAPRRAGGMRPGEGQLTAPRGQVAVEYALIGDTLLAWTIGDSIRLRRQVVNRDTFLLVVERANAALESNAPVPEQDLQSLYGWLIQPIRNHLGRPETLLVILADGEVAGVPFAALLDGDRYLIEDRPLRFAATLEDAARPPPRGSGPVLLVANPTFDAGQHLMLDPLPGASAEVRSLAAIYRNVVPLEEDRATRAAFVAQARRASLIHYAGHAVFNDARPERSFLLLAGADTTGMLTAQEVEAMRLDSVRLVVLSACSTLRSRSGRSGGFAGLSGALLTAGAGGVVGSLWEVNDRLAQPLMEGFHREYQRGADPASALREAQLNMLRSTEPRQRSPAVWAGFRYTGS